MGAISKTPKIISAKTPGRKRAPINRPPPEKTTTPKTIPKWPEYDRGGPPSIFRSSLFGIFHDRDRSRLIEFQMVSQGDLSVWYWGEELNQQDLDVLLAIFHLSRGGVPGEDIPVSQAELLRLCGVASSGQNITTLHERITRLIGALVDIQNRTHHFMGGLISSREWDEATGHMIFKLHPKIVEMFPNSSFTSFNHELRCKLGKNLLAQWLLGYYSSHINPLPVKVETLHAMCGAPGEPDKEFRRRLKVALQAIKDGHIAKGSAFDFLIQKNPTGNWLVTVVTGLSGSQMKYAIKHGINTRKRIRPPIKGLAAAAKEGQMAMEFEDNEEF